MAEIILSFFAVIGLLFLLIYLCDFFFYRNFKQTMTLTLDTRGFTTEQCIEAFELITSLRKMTAGKAAIGYLLVEAKGMDDENSRIAREYMQVFHIPGKIHYEEEQED